MKYRRKPDTVDAVRFDPEGEWPEGVWLDGDRYKIGGGVQWQTLNPGDWIVTDREGDVEVLTDEEFRELYELA